MNYTNEYSSLPYKIMERHYYKDIDNSVANEVNQIKELQAQQQYDKVPRTTEVTKQTKSTNLRTPQKGLCEILANRPDLKQYVMGSDGINAIDEETRNLEIFAMSKKQQIYYLDDEPEFAVEQDIWIGD